MSQGEQTQFAAWLGQRLAERNLSARAASLAAGLTHSSISKFMRGTQPNVESCRKLAAFFGVPEKTVLELAGYFEPDPEGDFIREWTYVGQRIPPEFQEMLLSMVRSTISRGAAESAATQSVDTD